MINYAEILIVDDMPDHIAYSSNILIAEGYRVFAATSGKAARKILSTRIPDLILLDIQMTDMSGLEICRRIKENIRMKDIPIIFLTSETSLDVISKGFELGASDYVKKPFIKEEFLARIRTQLRLSSQRKELVAANDELTMFCSAVTHDLKAPFNIVNMLIEMLGKELGDDRPETVAQIMDMITAKANQARIMIERLFEFSRMCNIKPDIKNVDIGAIAKEIYSDLVKLEPARDIEFNCGELPIIVADETLVHMAVKNLLQNAIKYTSKKQKAVIDVTSASDGAYYIIKVKDNGAGFDMEHVDKIFKVFERLHHDDEFQGTGVGLALVNRIMERHNGKIEAFGEVDKGAEFTLYFPKNIKQSADE